MYKYRYGIFLGLVALVLLVLSPSGIRSLTNLDSKDVDTSNVGKQVIVIDPGHGGMDPGKVGLNEVLEKEINLSIAIKLKILLEKDGYQVVLTRTADEGLYQSSDKNKKSTDMKNRVSLINETKPVVAVSIHQNSYPDSSVKGAQVFYHEQSPQGKVLAETIQQTLKDTLNDGNHRLAKSNSSYYMLKKTECPIVIVECGFLTNPGEVVSLSDETYQEKVAWAIKEGILQYINGNDG